MTSYSKIQDYVREQFGYTPETCWIAHVKELVGLPVRQAHNRQGTARVKRCPPEKQEHIRKAFEHFGMLKKEGAWCHPLKSRPFFSIEDSVNTNHIRWVHGVDFSGAKHAGRKIWIATGSIKEKMLEIKQCRAAEELPTSGRKREQSLSALVDFISREREAIIGMDFPFGLPAPLVKEDSWESFVLSFTNRFSHPEEFKEKCFSGANNKELRRTTDKEQRTPFSPYNLWLYKQTYYGIGHVIKPLMRQRRVSFLPMQKPITELSWVIEICPASALKNRGFNLHYKGKSPDRRRQRLQILKGIKEIWNVKIPQNLETKILDNSDGDALDSVIAAFAAFRSLPNLFNQSVNGNPIYTLEGYVYA